MNMNTSSLKIAVFHDLPGGGAKRALYELCRELSRQGHHLDLFIPETADEEFLPLDAFVKTKRVFPVLGARRTGLHRPASRTRLSWVFARHCHRKIAAAINQGPYEVVFVHQSIYPHMPFVLRDLTIPSVLYCQEPSRLLYESPIVELNEYTRYAGRSFRWREWFWGSALIRHVWAPLVLRQRAERKNIACATAVLANSYFSRESLLRAYGISTTVQYLGVDTERFRPLGLEKEPIVLTVGMVQPFKGFRFLVDSVARIDASIRPKVVIIGHGERRGERDILFNMAAAGGVDLAIYEVDDDELIRWYNRAMVVAFLPYLEPFGFIPLEAMACGTPVVGIREGGLRETIVDGETGFLIDRDPQCCAEALVRLLTDAALRERMGLAGRRLVETRWTWEQAGRRIAETLQKVGARGRGAAL